MKWGDAAVTDLVSASNRPPPSDGPEHPFLIMSKTAANAPQVIRGADL